MGYLNNDGLNKVFTKLKSQLDLKQDVLQTCLVSLPSGTMPDPDKWTKVATITDEASGFLLIGNVGDNGSDASGYFSRSSILSYHVGDTLGSFGVTFEWIAVNGVDPGASHNDDTTIDYVAYVVNSTNNICDVYIKIITIFDDTKLAYSPVRVINIPTSGGANVSLQSNQSPVELSASSLQYPLLSGVAYYAQYAKTAIMSTGANVLTAEDNVYDRLSIGDSTTPTYFYDGVPTECSYTLKADVPADAKFTDTTYSNATTSQAGLMSAEDKVALEGKANVSHTHTKDDITSVNASAITGIINASNLPSYVDDVLEYANYNSFPATGASGKIYIDMATNLTYRWSGTTYVEISPSLALGETSSTAYRGDLGKTAYTHATSDKGVQLTSGLYKITTGAEGHITAGSVVSKADITALGIPAQDTTYSNATEDAAGLMSASDKKALGGKMDSASPTGTGAFSLNRKSGTTTGQFSFAEGYNGTASGEYSHVEGREGQSTASCSHAEGYGTTANSRSQHVQGEYNVVDTASDEGRGTYAHIVGNGTNVKRSNAHTLDWSGNAWYAGNVYVGGANQAAGNKLATESYVDGATNGFVPTTRKVNGKALSADIAIEKSDIGLGNVDNTADANKSVLSAGKWTNAVNLTIGNKSESVDGSINVSWSLSEIGAAAADHNHDSSYFALNSTNNATGNQWLNNSTIDGGDFTSSSTLYGYGFGFKDKNNNTVGQIRTIQATNLLTEVEARRTVGSNTYYNYIRVGLSKTGEQLYQVSSPSAFRSSIGITSGTASPASSGTAGSIYIQYS